MSYSFYYFKYLPSGSDNEYKKKELNYKITKWCIRFDLHLKNSMYAQAFTITVNFWMTIYLDTFGRISKIVI